MGAGPSVARLQLGRFEDQFFATIFMGSGYIFLGLTFGAAALAGASLASAQQDPAFASSSTYDFARLAAAQLLTVFVPKVILVSAYILVNHFRSPVRAQEVAA